MTLMPSSSCASWNPRTAGGGGGGVSNQFPVGLRVLVVDDDSICLMILEKMLRHYKYEVTKCNRAEVALSFLRENKNGFDVVISDVHMPDMDGFKLLEHIGVETDLPVIMMSADDSKSVVMKSVTHGACDYLIKPIQIEALRNIWQHVVRKRKHEWKDFDQSASADEQKQPEEPDYSSSSNEGHNWKNTKRGKDEDDEAEERDESTSLKKPRFIWNIESHQQFVAAVNQLGIDKAVPKKILELMNVPGLTREKVASHLQKYRLYLRRLSGSQHPGGMNTGFMGRPNAGFASMSPLNGLDLQALAASGQFPPQSLTTIQAAALGGSSISTSTISMPFIDQRNILSFENSSRYPKVQSQQLTNNNSSKRINLLHWIPLPTNMEPKQFLSLHQSGGQSQINVQGQSQAQSNTNVHNGLRQPVMSNEMLGIPNIPTASSGNGNLDTKVARKGIVPSYDIFNLNQNRDWGIQDVCLTVDQPQHIIQVGLDASNPLLLQQHNCSSDQDLGGQNRNLTSGKVILSQGFETRTYRNGSKVGQHRNTYVKIENDNDGRCHNTLLLWARSPVVPLLLVAFACYLILYSTSSCILA